MEEQDILVSEAVQLCTSIQQNTLELIQEMKLYHQLLLEDIQSPYKYSSMENMCNKEYTQVELNVIQKLITEVLMMKEFLPTVLEPSVTLIPQLTQTEQELVSLRHERDRLLREKQSLLQRVEGFMSDYEHEKHEKFELKCSYTEVTSQLQQQIEYCSLLGSVCGNLLWRTSQNEDCIQNLLSGSRVGEFIQLVSNTVQSYLTTYQNELPNDSSQETQFVLSLCGTIANIAASAYGREYLSTSTEGQTLITGVCSILATAPISEQCAKMKSLILMLLYNISINQKGLSLLRAQPNILRILMWLSKEDSNETVKIHSLQLLQSLILEPLSSTELIHQVLEAIDVQVLQEMSASKNQELKQIACEIMMDLQKIQNC